MTSTSNQYSVTTVQLDMNMLSAFASPNEPDSQVYAPILTINSTVSFIGRLSRLISSTFGAGNTAVYASDDAYNKV